MTIYCVGYMLIKVVDFAIVSQIINIFLNYNCDFLMEIMRNLLFLEFLGKKIELK